ncbi:MAG: hypothetical protein JOZ01_02885 [Candidatus Eremiobacteraeota bacterium]|nr:hypothetical protein [Candidatus Eremiobacteraeota bacterium]
MRVFADGRHGKPGLIALGFDCCVFDGGTGSLRDRIDQCNQFVAGLRAANAASDRVALFGYSAGGLIARGLVRAHPDARIAAVFQLAAPNAGIVTDDPKGLLRRMHFDRSVLEDLDMESGFLRWLNGTQGHWAHDRRGRRERWVLEKAPWVIADGVAIVNAVGRVPRYGNRSDGIVFVESATLDGAMPHAFLDGKRANHLNLGGTWNPLTVLLRRWACDDTFWPRAVELAAALFR